MCDNKEVLKPHKHRKKMIYITTFIYIFAGISYLSSIIEREKIIEHINSVTQHICDVPRIPTIIKGNGIWMHILIVLIWPIVSISELFTRDK